MHQSDKQCPMYYHLRYEDLISATYVKSGTTMEFGLLSLVDYDLEDCSEPEVLVQLVHVTHR
jgi:hypothetical protein